MIKRLLIIGANGMLGGSLHRYFSRKGTFAVLGTVRTEASKVQIATRGFDNIVSGVDISDLDAVSAVFEHFKPDVVLNCVGLIKQLAESKQPIPAIEVNSLLPHKLAKLCSESGARLVHFSTDCVFSGSVGLYAESDTPDAIDIYGRSKLLGEVDYSPHITLRTSIIGHEMNSKVSLIDWFLSQTNNVKGFSRALFSGMPTIFVAQFIDEYILPNPHVTGLKHLSVDCIDKYSLLVLVKEVYGKKIEIIESSEFSIDRSLNSSELRKAVGFTPPTWPELVGLMHKEYLSDFNQ